MGKNETGKEGKQGSKKRGKLVSRFPLWAVEALVFMIVYHPVGKVGFYPHLILGASSPKHFNAANFVGTAENPCG